MTLAHQSNQMTSVLCALKCPTTAVHDGEVYVERAVNIRVSECTMAYIIMSKETNLKNVISILNPKLLVYTLCTSPLTRTCDSSSK